MLICIWLVNILILFNYIVPLTKQTQFVPWVHIDDVIGAIIFCLNKSQTQNINGPYNIVSSMAFSTSYEDIIQCLSFLLHKSQFYYKFPSTIQNIVSKMSFEILSCYYNNEVVDLITKGHKVKPQKLLQDGYKFKYSTIEKALKNVIEQF